MGEGLKQPATQADEQAPTAPNGNAVLENLWEHLDGDNVEGSLRSQVKDLLHTFAEKKRHVVEAAAKKRSSLDTIDLIHTHDELYIELLDALDEIMAIIEQSTAPPELAHSLHEEVLRAQAVQQFEATFETLSFLEKRFHNGKTSDKLDQNLVNILRSALQGDCIQTLLTHRSRLPLIAHEVEHAGRDRLRGEEYENLMLSTVGVAEVILQYSDGENNEVFVAPATMDANDGVDVVVVDKTVLTDEQFETVRSLLNNRRTGLGSLEACTPDIRRACTYVQVKARHQLPRLYEKLIETNLKQDPSVSQLLHSMQERASVEGLPTSVIPAPTALDDAVKIHARTLSSTLVPGLSVGSLSLQHNPHDAPHVTWDAAQATHAAPQTVPDFARAFVEDRETLLRLFGNTYDTDTGQDKRHVVIVDAGDLVKLFGGNLEKKVR